MRKRALVWFIAVFIAISATPALGDNSSAANEPIDNILLNTPVICKKKVTSCHTDAYAGGKC